MNTNIFDTRQRTNELLTEAIAIWRQSAYSEKLEGIEKDPVFMLLMTAIAHQANETDNEIERLKNEVIDEYTSTLIPYEALHATPATLLATVCTSERDFIVNETTTFTLGDSNHTFLPVLRTRLLPNHTTNVTRIDGRHWKVHLNLDSPISNISLLSFAIANASFKDLSISLDGHPLNITRPCDFHDIPLVQPLSLRHAFYNETNIYDPSTVLLDLFAQQNTQLFTIKPGSPGTSLHEETSKLEFIIEFYGIDTDFIFDSSQITFNAVLLANYIPHTCTLDRNTPIVRLLGDSTTAQTLPEQLLHILIPPDEQIHSNAKVRLRRVAGDRFNQSSLLKLLSIILDKIQTDYYAFMDLSQDQLESMTANLRRGLRHTIAQLSTEQADIIPGIYLMFSNPFEESSLQVNYLTTLGAEINKELQQTPAIKVPNGLIQESARIIADPIPGTNQNTSPNSDTVRYMIQTNDRIVTPADIKAFCYKELVNRYGIIDSMVKDITIFHTINDNINSCGYNIQVNITILDSPYIRRGFQSKKTQAELILQKMMQVRSANIYPIHVVIEIQ